MRIGLASKKQLAIDWDARNLRLVLVRRRVDGVDLLKAVSIPMPPDVKMDDAEALGAFLREAMQQAKVGVRQVVMSVPRDQVVLNTLSLPPTPPEELAAIVQFQIVKELPFAVEQATLDFVVGSNFDPKEPCSVLVAAVRNEQLELYRKTAYEAGLAVERIGLRPHANLLAVTARSTEDKSKTLLLIDVGPQLTEISIIRNDTLVFSRAASVALAEYGSVGTARVEDSRVSSLELRDREPDESGRRAVNSLMVEIVRSFEAHRATDPGVNVDRIVVCGASGLEPQLAQMLAARFAAQAELYSPERALDLTPQRAKELRGFSAPVGLALGHAQKSIESIDFLHPKKPVSKRTVQLRKLPIAVATALLFLGSGIVSYIQYVRPKEKLFEQLDGRLELRRKKAKDIDEFKTQVEAIEAWRDTEQYWPEVLAMLSENLPPDNDVLVTRLDFESRSKAKAAAREGRVSARLRTASLGKVNAVTAKLKELGFTEVKAGKETPIGSRRDAGIYQNETDVEAVLPPRAKAKPKPKSGDEIEDETPPANDKPKSDKPVDKAAGNSPPPAAPAEKEKPLTAETPPPAPAGADEKTDEPAAAPSAETPNEAAATPPPPDESGGEPAATQPAAGAPEDAPSSPIEGGAKP